MVFLHDFGIALYTVLMVSISPESFRAISSAIAWTLSFSALVLSFRRPAMSNLCRAKSTGWGRVDHRLNFPGTLHFE
jgi:hypothetical protein